MEMSNKDERRQNGRQAAVGLEHITNDAGRSGATAEGAGEDLTPQQHAALIALLEHSTVREAASSAGVHKATLYKWLQDPAFRAAYRVARREAITRATARLQQVSSEAVEVLREVMNDPAQQGAARVGAARIVLDYAARMTELEDLGARVEVLEGRGA